MLRLSLCVRLVIGLLLAGICSTQGGAVDERIRFLRAEIARHDELYFRQARPEISDADYDGLKRELAFLESGDGEVTRSTSEPTNLGDDRAVGFQKAPHRRPMLSLNKAYTRDEVLAFARGVERAAGRPVEFLLEPKFDGVAISAVYVNGTLQRVVTRGNGHEGDDVTANALRFTAIPRVLKTDALTAPEFIEIRGEAYLTFAEFQRLCDDEESDGEAPYATPRNLAAGTLKSTNLPADTSRNLDVVFYAVGEVVPGERRLESESTLLETFGAWGLPTVETAQRAARAEEVWPVVQQMAERRESYPFPTDGVVVKVNAAGLQRELGENDYAPRWAVAFKFSALRTRARVRGITLQVGRSGQLTPVAELEPVELGGTRITRATLHNAAELARRDVRIGDYVFLERAGDVIPNIVSVDREARTAESRAFLFPSTCPSCGASVAERGRSKWCPNLACPEQLKRRIRHLASPSALGLRGLGEATIDALVTARRVNDLADLFRLTEADLVSAGMTSAGAQALLAAVEKSKGAELWRWIHGLGIPGVGERSARQLANVGSLTALAAADEATLQAAGLSASGARRMREFLARADVRRSLQALAIEGVAPAH